MTTGTTKATNAVTNDPRPIRQLVFEELALLLNAPVSTWLDPVTRDGKYIHVRVYRRHNNAGPGGNNFDLFVAIRPLGCTYCDIAGIKVRLDDVVAEANQFGLVVFYNLSDGWYEIHPVAE